MNKKRTLRNISGVSEGISRSIKQAKTDEGSLRKRLPFLGKSIAISVSKSEDLAGRGLSELHLKDLMVELARYLLVNGARLLYAGDLRQGGYTKMFAELAEQYTLRPDQETYFVNYFPFPNSKVLTTDVKAKFKQQRVGIKELKPPKQVGRIDPDRDYEPFVSVEDRFTLAECFADMRRVVAEDCDARVVVGGQMQSYLGYFPGIIEEAYYTLKADKPLFVVGGFGGAAARIADVVNNYAAGVFPKSASPEEEFTKKLREYAAEKSKSVLDRDVVDSAFGAYRLTQAAKRTGLKRDEATSLLNSTNVHEIVFLIVKGLQRLFSK